jgi:tRNA threonylcarbamoyl adenosine modification protein (Sua5/YciO/YrdC/YwlC family)
MRVLDDVGAAAALLADGEVVAIPTDTVYGLAASVAAPDAVRRLFDAKGRREDVPLPLFVANASEAAAMLGDLEPRAMALFELWPGPLTVVVATSSPLATLLGAPGSVGVRCPADPTDAALLATVGPLAVTSANRSGAPPATTAAEVVGALGGSGLVSAVLDGGPRTSPPSTVVRLGPAGVEVLREGSIDASTIEEALRRG